MEWIKKNKKIVIAVLVVIALLIVGLVIILLGNGVKQTKDTITVEAGEELNLKAQDFLDISDKKAEKVELDTSAVNVDKVGDYEVVAKYGKKEYVVTLEVEDTTAPQVEMKSHIIYTSDMTTVTADESIDVVYDASKYEVVFTGYEKVAGLEVVNDEYVGGLEGSISEEANVEGLSEEVPTEEGVYRSVLKFVDKYSNETLVEVYIIYDAPDPVVEETTTEINTTTDNGGSTNSGNSGSNKTTSNSGNTNSNSSSNSGNGGSTTSNSNSGSTSNQTTTNSTGKVLTENQAALVNAGYYKVIQLSNGYGVMVHGRGEDGIKALELLQAYLNPLGYDGSLMYGSWIDNLNDQYGYYVYYENLKKLEDLDLNNPDIWEY